MEAEPLHQPENTDKRSEQRVARALKNTSDPASFNPEDFEIGDADVA